MKRGCLSLKEWEWKDDSRPLYVASLGTLTDIAYILEDFYAKIKSFCD